MVALVIAMVMTLAMVVPAMASENTTLKVAPVDGHTYTAYQLFEADLADDGKTISNVKWGANAASSITYYEKANATATEFTVEKTIAPTVGASVPQAVLDYLNSLDSKADTQDGTPEAAAQETADIISTWVTGTGTTVTAAGITVKTGYYVVKDAYTDTSATATQDTTLSTVICEVVGPTTITPKAGTVEHKKEVLDINDTTDVALDLTKLQNVTEGWDKSADHDFGDHVPFKLTTKIGSDFKKYDNYYLAVVDTLKDGLKLDSDSIKVYVDGKLAAAGTEDGQYLLTYTNKEFRVEFNKLNANTNAAAGKDVVVYYTATLDGSDANIVIGNSGNWNESYAEFSNNPNGNQEGKGKTPKSTAVVFTYKTVVNKVDKDKDPLKGAEFTLTKKLKNGTTATIAVIKYKEDGSVTTTTADGTSTSTGDATTFSFNGLDDGVYTLTETVTPDGYNTIDPVVFTVEATHDGVVDSGITDLEVKNEDGSAFTGELTFTADEDAGSLTTDVVNNEGIILPSTGGIGTTIFYVVGAILVLGAGIILVTKRRMSAN